MEKHVVSMELARELYHAGYPQEPIGQFYWVIGMTTPYHISFVNGYKSLLPKSRNDYYVAPLADEILDRLPNDIQIFKSNMAKDGWTIGYETINTLYTSETDYSLADAAAKMWLYLKKENLL